MLFCVHSHLKPRSVHMLFCVHSRLPASSTLWAALWLHVACSTRVAHLILESIFVRHVFGFLRERVCAQVVFKGFVL
jgi:hypothetical protein